jgi:hypothetical protein
MLYRARAIQVGISTAILAACIAPVRAEIGWQVDAGVSHTDNATLTDNNGVSDTLTTAGGAIAYDLDGRRIQASLTGHGNYVHYLDNTYDDDFQSFARGDLVVRIIPETFLWTLDDTYGQIAINQFSPVTPDNRQNINTFNTGPDFLVRLGNQSDLKLTGRYSNSQYEETDNIDSEKLTGSIAFRRHLSDSSYWGIVATDSHIKYDAPGDPTYDQPGAYATWSTTGARQTIAVDVGASRVETEDASFTTPLVHVNWSRRVAPSWTMDVHLASEYQNTSDQFVSQNLIRDPGTAEIGVSQAPAATYTGGLAFAFQRARTNFNVGGGYSRLDYVDDNSLNENSWYGTVELRRRHTPQLEGFVNYRIEKRNYQNNPLREDTRQRAELGLDWRVGKSLFLTTGYQYNNADSDSVTNRYSANMVYLTLSYRQGALTGPRGLAQ